MTRLGVWAVFFAMTVASLVVSVSAQRPNPQQQEDALLPIFVNDKTGYINRSGRIVIPPTFDLGQGFGDGRAPALSDKRWGFIDRTGTFVIPPQFEYARVFHEGLAEVELNGQWGL